MFNDPKRERLTIYLHTHTHTETTPDELSWLYYVLFKDFYDLSTYLSWYWK